MPSLNEFKSSFNKDVARPNRFDVSIPVPLVLIPYIGTARDLNMRCEATQFPSRTFSTTEQRFGSNPTEKFPYQSSYNEIEMTFIVGGDMAEKKMFDAWMEYIQPSYNFDFKYKKDYVTTMQVNQYDNENKLTYSINLIDSFPVSINQLDLDWTQDGYHKLTVVFAYTYWQNNSLQALGSSLLQSGLSNIVAGFEQGGLTGAFESVKEIIPSAIDIVKNFNPFK
jgi:hypothetical protein